MRSRRGRAAERRSRRTQLVEFAVGRSSSARELRRAAARVAGGRLWATSPIIRFSSRHRSASSASASRVAVGQRVLDAASRSPVAADRRSRSLRVVHHLGPVSAPPRTRLSGRRPAEQWAARPIFDPPRPSPTDVTSPAVHRLVRDSRRRSPARPGTARAARHRCRSDATREGARSAARRPPSSGAIARRPGDRRASSSRATPTLSLAPASNEKLTVTLRALQELGPAYRFRTEVLGARRPGRRRVARRRVPEGLRRPDAHVTRISTCSRGAAARCGDHARRRARSRRRVVVRLGTHGARLEGVATSSTSRPPLSALVVDRASYENHVARSRRSPRPAVPASSCACTASQPARRASAGHRRRAYALATIESAPLPRRRPRRWTATATTSSPRKLLKTLGAEARRRRHDRGGRGGRAPRPHGRGHPAHGCADRRRLGPLARRPAHGARARRCSSSLRGTTPTLRELLCAALPVAGVSGTLEDRMRRRRSARRRSREDGHDGRRLRALGLRARPVRLRGPPERVAGGDDSRRAKAQDRFATALASAL